MMNNENCKKPTLKCLVPVIAVFATIFVFEWLFHGVYMMPEYQATASHWRPMAEMQTPGMIAVCILTKLLMAAAICCLYCWVSKGCESQGKCTKKGAKFGFKIGLLLGAQQFASYIWLPITMDMAVKWFIGNVIMGVLIGVVLAKITSMCPKGGMAA
jgi:hypothetical protein